MKKLFIATILALLLIPSFAFAEITKSESIGQITVQENGVINVNKIMTISENGQTISTKDQFVQFTPGQDVSAEDQKVQDMAQTVWTEAVIAEYQSEQTGAALTLNQQKEIKLKKLYANIKYFTNTLPNGMPRYDTDLKMGIMNAIMSYMAAGQPVPASLTNAKNWMMTIQGVFVAKKAAIEAVEVVEPETVLPELIEITGEMTEQEVADATAANEAATAAADATNAANLLAAQEAAVAALDAIDISVATLESQYGREGTVLADPGISTADLIQ
jgi:opacity protein-like surface antigen